MAGEGSEFADLTADQYRALIRRTSDVITVVDADGTITYQSPSSEHVKGWEPSELVGENILDYIHPTDRPRVIDKFSVLTEESGFIDEELEFRFQTKDDGWTWLAVTGTAPGPESPIDGYITTSREISERKTYERQLERYKELVQRIPVGIYRNTPGKTGSFVEVNPAMVEMFDADSTDHLLAQDVCDLYADPDDRQAFSERLVADGIVTEHELEMETLSGERFWGAVTAICTTSDGETYFDGVIQDVTERKAYEQQLRDQRNDLETLNQVVRHDIRNDLQLISSYTELLEGHADEDGQQHLETIWESANNAVQLTRTARELTDVMLRADDDVEPTALAPALEGPIDAVRSTYPDADVTLEGALPETTVLADELLDSVFRNLLTNAVQHNDKETPKVTVSVDADDDRVTVRIADNGPGVPDTQKNAIFGKGEKGLESSGTGVGLYLVQSLVDSYDGDVWVEDNDPEGAVFVVELPGE